MPAFKPQQCRITIRNRAFHFVSYEGQPANVAKNEEAKPSMWYMMMAGRRFPSLVCIPGQSEPEIEQSLTTWALANAIAAEVPLPVVEPAAPARKRSRR